MSNTRFQNAIDRRSQPTPPVWMMRQAGRYHAHYQQLRRSHSFHDLCKKPELSAEVALGPVLDFGFDAAILFSDLLFPLEAMGMGLEYTDAGPSLGWRLDEDNIDRLAGVEQAWPDLAFQGEAVRLTRGKLPPDRSLIGFVGGPWTLFSYAVEGKHSGALVPSKRRLGLFERFCNRLVPLLARSINDQFANGAEVVMILDTAAGELSPEVYSDFVVPQLELLARLCHRRPGYYSKGTQPVHLRHAVFTEGALSGVGVDYRWDMREALEMFSAGFVQGNFDPALLLLEAPEFEARLHSWLAPLRGMDNAGWICGLGHGILPGTPERNVRNFVGIVREVIS